MGRFSRLTSKAYDTFFSIGSTLTPSQWTQAVIDTYKVELECWRTSIPEEFRPSNPFQVSKFLNNASMAITLRVHYYYYSVFIALSWLSLNLQTGEPLLPMIESKKALMNAVRVIVELTRYIDTEAYIPIWSVVCC
jgi:hypothetical protein